MLYVSQNYGDHLYGVVDSEDDTEEIVSIDKLHDIVNLGVSIKGVKTRTIVTSDGVVKSIYFVSPVQNPETMTAAQTKLAVLSRVNVCVYHDIVTSVKWDTNEIMSPVTIRLSDYGHILGRLAFSNNTLDDGGNKLTVILDDKFHIHQNTIPQARTFSQLGVVFDLRELTHEQVARVVYWGVRGEFDPDSRIIDSPERMKRLGDRYW